MADSIKLIFNKTINSSIQPGDTVYKSIITNDIPGSPVEIGECTAISTTTNARDTVFCNINEWEVRPSNTDFIFFTKDNKANLSSLKGYYAEVAMNNDSYNEVELFSVGSEVSINSK
tara:strand:+ start:8373 stop:8723 length:351 start_codon:yes stop_codon:yes gene_type:complete